MAIKSSRNQKMELLEKTINKQSIGEGINLEYDGVGILVTVENEDGKPIQAIYLDEEQMYSLAMFATGKGVLRVW